MRKSLHFATEKHKSLTLPSDIGSENDPATFKAIENVKIFITTDTTKKSKINITLIPTAFFIRTLPARVKSKLSLINPPTIGIELESKYFVALNEIPSKIPTERL